MRKDNPAAAQKTHNLLRGAIEVWTRSYLWTPGDTPNFKPALCDRVFGDGRALFALATLDQRPRYYVICGDSRWSCDLDYPGSDGDEDNFGEHVDKILEALENQFGTARCGYCGTGLSSYAHYVETDEPSFPQCDDPSCSAREDIEAGCGWPSVDDNGGCSWGRLRWPAGFATVPHPWHRQADLLREDFRP